MHRRSLLAAAAALALPTAAALAQGGWPNRPVRLIVPAPAGSSLDIIARLLGDKLKDRWGQSVVVENKPGAGGLLGMDAAAKAPPDGHVLALGFNGPIAFAPFMYSKLPFDPAHDLAPVAMTTSQPNVLAVHAALPVRTVREFVGWARERGGRMSYASLGKGSSSHLTMELFMAEAGIQGTHIPFNGSPPSAMSVAQGETDATMMVAPALLPHVRSGRVRLLAVTSRQRLDSLRDVPTLAESGYPDIEALAWNGFFTAAATPQALVERINADVNAVLQDAGVRAALEQQGLTPVGGSAAAFRELVANDTRRWGAIIRKIGLKLES
ncbi:Bug family tripartite tricarboxylate transporter substrate binding protein [Azohydromonas lata]|uniref:Tripartite tricarboxylate transporter substrate binding protein n=1 Tax=Azohydromonas lata TaxID=45677 RepID=A0ABU5IG84_9BURK|nr:tripartite tricarboxylate transporter substrate binding protein [Azohydromonas lata]MDZ5458140.1 tripartite tricarboxylate transporter substrate binding protein [Azohydromonas lata]